MILKSKWKNTITPNLEITTKLIFCILLDYFFLHYYVIGRMAERDNMLIILFCSVQYNLVEILV